LSASGSEDVVVEDVIAGAGDEEVDEAVVEEPVGVAAEFTVETPYISQNVIN
jgi:hypothetical protein